MNDEKKTINVDGLSDRSIEEKVSTHAVMVKTYGYWGMKPIMRG